MDESPMIQIIFRNFVAYQNSASSQQIGADSFVKPLSITNNSVGSRTDAVCNVSAAGY